ncbi:MAG: efflux RND transporter periplasmic adaptor subunit [Selenomonadaceae bacterium]|nr:efflux RND transporter periplasmic adaptor subunit [Selenomonadaceae bacterium]
MNNHRVKRSTKWKLTVFGVIALLAVGFWYLHQSPVKKQQMKQSKPLVQVEKIERADMMRHINLSGQTVAEHAVTLAPKYAGRVSEVRVKLGDTVKAGDILLIQDTGDLDISVMETQASAEGAVAEELVAAATYDANYYKAKSDYELERDQYTRTEYLFSIGAISRDTLDSAKQEYLSKKAAFEVLENQVKEGRDAASVLSKRYAAEKLRHNVSALKKQRDDLILRAPIDGMISYRKAEVGEIITAGSKVISIVDGRNIYVDCTLSESDAAILKTGDSVPITIDAMGKTYPARIIYVSPAMDDTAKTYTVRLDLLNDEGGEIKTGLFARGHIDILQRENTLFVPKEAVFYKNGKPVIFVINEDNGAEERQVTIGLLNDTHEEILSGLNAGESVALNNQDKLSTGTRVDIREEEK